MMMQLTITLIILKPLTLILPSKN